MPVGLWLPLSARRSFDCMIYMLASASLESMSSQVNSTSYLAEDYALEIPEPRVSHPELACSRPSDASGLPSTSP